MTSPNPWPSFLEGAIASPFKHALLLKSLSYLEYIGYRKMVKAVPYEQVSKGVFNHLSDEIQHSFLLKEVSDKLFPEQAFSAEIQQQSMTIAEAYFQNLDSQVKSWTLNATEKENPYLNYLWVSYIIEKRAMKVYPHYSSQAAWPALKAIIQKISRDENEHLNYLEEGMKGLPEKLKTQSPELFNLEEELFKVYLEQMSHCFEMA